MQYNSNLPLVTIDRVSLYSDNQKTKVELLLVLKSTEQQLVAENLKIKILQCTNQNMFSFLTQSKELCLYAAYPDATPSSLDTFIKNLAENKGLIPNDGDSAELKAAFNNTDYLNQEEIGITNDAALYSEMEDGMYRHYFSVTLDIDSTRIEHLSYFVFTDFDRDTTTTDQLHNIFKKVKINTDCIINENKVISQSYAFYLPSGDVWLGPVTRDGNMWRTGGPYDLRTTPLQRRTFFNKKIQDFRTFDRIEASPMYIEEIDQFERLQNQNPFYHKIKKQNSIIFDQFQKITGNLIGERNQLKFQINKQKLLEDYSPFYNFYSSDIDFGNNWMTVQVFRKRIVSRYRYSTKDSINSPLAWQGENTPVYVGIPTSPSSSENGLITYLITDYDISNIKIGQYYYHIVVQFKDPYYSQIQADLDSLKTEKQKLETYYQLSTIPGNFNSKINKFKKEFGDISEINSYITGPIEVYVEKFKIFNKNEISPKSKNLITSMISPETGSPSGIMRLIELYNRLINTLSRFIKSVSGTVLYTAEKEFNKNEQIIYRKKETVETGYDPSNDDSDFETLKQFYGVTTSFPSNEVKNLFESYVEVTAGDFDTEGLTLMSPEPGIEHTPSQSGNPYVNIRDVRSARKYVEQIEQDKPPTPDELRAAAAATSGATNTSARLPLKTSSATSQNNSPGAYLNAQKQSPAAEQMSNAQVQEYTTAQLQDKGRSLNINNIGR